MEKTLTLSEKLKKILENDFFYDGGHGSIDRETDLKSIDDAIEVLDFLRKGEWKKIEPDVSSSCSSSSPSFESPLSEQDMIDPLTNSSGQRFLENVFSDGVSGRKDRETALKTIDDGIEVLDFLRKGKWKKIEPDVSSSSSFEDPLSKQCMIDPLIISSGQRLKKFMGEDREIVLKMIKEDIGVLNFFRKGKWKKIEPHVPSLSSPSSPWFEGPLSKHYMIDPLMISFGQRKKILAEDFGSKDCEAVLKTIDEAIGLLNFLKKIEFDVPLSSSSSIVFEDASNLMIRNISFDLCDLPVDLAAQICKKLDINDVLSMKEVCHRWLELAKQFSTRRTLGRRIVTLIHGRLTMYNMNKVGRGESEVCRSSFSGWKLIGSVAAWVLLNKEARLKIYHVLLDTKTTLPKLPVGKKPLFAAFSGKPNNTSSVLFLLCSARRHVFLLKLLNGDTAWRMVTVNGLDSDSKYLNSMHLLNEELHLQGDSFEVTFNPLRPNELIRQRVCVNRSHHPDDLVDVLRIPNNSLTVVHGTVLGFEKMSFALVKTGTGRDHITAVWIDLGKQKKKKKKSHVAEL